MTGSFYKDFGPFDGKVWLNSASEGPLPRVAVEALHEAVEWKIKPHLLTNEKFADVPRNLKKILGRLINVPAPDIILGNSATYGIHLLANGIQWQAGDEILVMRNDFPVDILPWLALEKKGVRIRQLEPASFVLTPEELERQINAKTKLFCISHVHTFSGHKADIEKMGVICRSQNVIFVANLTQTLGNAPLDVSSLPVDAVTSSGFKWLCGPYGTGFCWIKPELREALEYNHSFWVSVLSAEDLAANREITLPQVRGAGKFDVFGTANFFNFYPWSASIKYLLDIGIERIRAQNNILINNLINGLIQSGYDLISPQPEGKRSALVVFSHKNPALNLKIFNILKVNGIFGAFWKGNIRISPHVFNVPEDIGKLLSVLKQPFC